MKNEPKSNFTNQEYIGMWIFCVGTEINENTAGFASKPLLEASIQLKSYAIVWQSFISGVVIDEKDKEVGIVRFIPVFNDVMMPV